MSFNVRMGSILDEVKSGIIIQQVNAQGVMGSGFAKAIRDRYPAVWTEYSRQVRPHTIDMGACYMDHVVFVKVLPELHIANIVGQQFYGREKKRYTSYEAVYVGLEKIAKFAEMNNISEIHYPTIGCGLGGASWVIISSMLKVTLSNLNHTLWCLPGETPK